MAEYSTTRKVRSAFRFVPIIFALMLAGCAPQFEAWRASDVAGPPDSSPRFVMLQAKTRGEGIVNTSTVRKLIDIKDRIEHAAAYARTDFYLASGNDGPNAYATVIENGPVIGINLAMIGLFDTDSDAYAGVLSHLYAHLKLNHAGTRKERSVQQSAADTMSTTLKSMGIPVYSGAEQAALTAMKTVYSPEEELEADQAALQYLKKAGFDSNSALRAWQRMVSVSSQGAVPFLETHPATEQRIAIMRKLAAKQK